MGFLQKAGLVVARKWIGGITIENAINTSKKINADKEQVILNYLGEEFRDNAKIQRSTNVYLHLIKAMKEARIKGAIAVKPTQLGLCIDYELFLYNYTEILGAAKRQGIFVWLDMEDYRYVDSTITAYMSALRKYGNTGICIQAKLTRSINDLEKIVPKGAMIRLVKGAYKTREGVTYGSKQEVDKNYYRCMYYLFKHSKYFMIATHDDRLIQKALSYQKEFKKKMVFGMLKGIRPKLAAEISKDNEMYIYVPFGEEWIDYSIRRLKELEHSMLVLRSIFQG